MTNPDDLLPEGLEDRLPTEARAVSRAMRQILDVMDAHGYDRVSPPLVEFEKSLAGRMVGGNDGTTARRMFRFVDPVSLRMLAVRSDMTPQIGRIAATGLAAAARPLRLCYGGEVALVRADQLDPARQRLQLGAELIGSDTVAAAAEMIALAIEALEGAGAKGISVDFTLPDLVDILAKKALPLAPERIAQVRRELDTKDAGGLALVPGGAAYMPLLYATGPFDEAIARLFEIDAGGALASRIAGLKQIAERVAERARLTLDPTERHGFEYQSWFGFTIYADGVRGAVGRGGTYAIGGTDEPATGFSLYIDAMIGALKASPAADILFLPLGHDRDVAARLRAIGWRTREALSGNDDAEALGCTHRLDGREPTAL
ncbi:ATP phosphoribosyltransferase regulatory subunit [Allopontixanthobacter sp.]|uniref:ATP phosphoribosyltransferase regulatory subunit n=1 Tax=Allopontixanthobacter sp. TaxID=2906452 RepID=UPI002ABA52E7|nr:ATP phosphoribosyltransferase regulatory subunit [Allopontixanthobacter sp.]MDZ4307823.1 ATP phosphoribosyltransferase regulatory subunit [Allopontixanthobacter sp.]